MTRKTLLFLTGSAVFLVLLVAKAPAGILGPFLADAGVHAAGYSGTLWNGTAEGLRIGSVHADHADWQLRPSRLFVGRLAAHVDAALPRGFIRGDVSWSLGGRIRVHSLEASAPAEALNRNLATLVPGGEVAVQLAEFVWHDDWPEAVSGTVSLGNIALGIPGESGRGAYVARFDDPAIEPGEPVIAELADTGGPLEVGGAVSFTPPRNYDVSGTARVRPGAPAELGQMLRLAGPQRADGSHTFSFAGSF